MRMMPLWTHKWTQEALSVNTWGNHYENISNPLAHTRGRVITVWWIPLWIHKGTNMTSPETPSWTHVRDSWDAWISPSCTHNTDYTRNSLTRGQTTSTQHVHLQRNNPWLWGLLPGAGRFPVAAWTCHMYPDGASPWAHKDLVHVMVVHHQYLPELAPSWNHHPLLCEGRSLVALSQWHKIICVHRSTSFSCLHSGV